MRSFGSGMAVISVGFLAASLAWPSMAERFLQMLLATLAFGFVGAYIYRSRLPARMAHDTYSPFDRLVDGGPPSESPAAIRELTHRLEAAADPAKAKRVPIPGEAVRIILAEASRRLAEHHGLSLRAPGDRERIRGVLSQPTWTLIRRGIMPFDAMPEATAYDGPVPLSELGRILDDLEEL